MLDRMFMGAAADDKLFVEDVFSTYLYTGGADQNIINNIDLVGKGGLVWIKIRNATDGHALFDTDRGVNRKLISNSSGASSLVANSLTNFYSSGFRVGGGDGAVNSFGGFFGSWTFRKSPKFFDVVTYTGNGVNGRQISHSLGGTPGMMIVKCTSSTASWAVYHRSLTQYGNAGIGALVLNNTDGNQGLGSFFWNNTDPTSTVFTVGNSNEVNTNGATYVAYLFAHDATADGIIQCGNYVGNGSASGPVVTLGWEPQWVLIKNATTGATDWFQFDNMRGLSLGDDSYFRPNLSSGEISATLLNPTATGFEIKSTWAELNTSGNAYIYIAIRRGPMRTPTLGTSVFTPITQSSGTNPRDIDVGINPDLMIAAVRSGSNITASDRLRGDALLVVNLTAADTTGTTQTIVGRANNLVRISSANISGFATSNSVFWNFRRAPGFMDVVCYTGTGVARTVNHNLGVAPELMIVKCRSGAYDWAVYSANLGNTQYLLLNTTAAKDTGVSFWNSTTPSSTTFTIGLRQEVNISGPSYVAYLFASCPGVSKVGSYTGNGSSQTINCAFAAGARFVMIKRTDSTGDWYVWDTARGIVAANDPRLSLNSTAAEVTTDDSVDTASSGFVVNQVAATNVNVNAATYIYLAIA